MLSMPVPREWIKIGCACSLTLTSLILLSSFHYGFNEIHPSSWTIGSGSHSIEHVGLEHPVQDVWQYDPIRDSENYDLDQSQCESAFPKYYHEIERAVAWRESEGLPKITESQMDVSWRKDGEMLRVMIYNHRLYIVDQNWALHGLDLPRAIAILQSIYRSIIAYHGSTPIPNVEFTFTLSDWPGDRKALWPIWVLTRWKGEHDKWVIPDFGYWSWPIDVLGEYSQVRSEMVEREPRWDNKINKVVWRGSVQTNQLRQQLVNLTEGQPWSDIRAIEWKNSTEETKESAALFIPIADHCRYRFLMHTEGNSYSGRGKYLLNCESVSVVPDPEWIEPHSHLMIRSGPDQNIIGVKYDLSDLKAKVEDLVEHPETAHRIASNAAAQFRDRYLTPAAQACYWRKMFAAWATVSFEPRLFNVTTDEDGRERRQLRGIPFESFIAKLQLPNSTFSDWNATAKTQN